MEGELAGVNSKSKLKYGVNGFSHEKITSYPIFINIEIKGKAFNHSIGWGLSVSLLKSRIPLRYIQVLLGHKISKTTEIYTYVNTKNLLTIKNSLDGLLTGGRI